MDQFLQSKNWQKMQCETNTCFQFNHGFAEFRRMRFGLKQIYVGRAFVDQESIAQLEKKAIDNKVDLIRLDPLNNPDLPNFGYVAVKSHQPPDTLILELSKSIEELNKELHPKTRYNISLAQRKGVSVVLGDKNDFESFWRLIYATYKRKGISAHQKNYYWKLLDKNPDVYLALAKYQDQVVAANMMIRSGDTVTYLHGGTDAKFKQLMAPHLLQWSEIARAKNDGYQYYDFWGIAPNEDPKHPWAGITRFKKGFGGKVVSYPGTWEKGLTWKYKLYKILRSL